MKETPSNQPTTSNAQQTTTTETVTHTKDKTKTNPIIAFFRFIRGSEEEHVDPESNDNNYKRLSSGDDGDKIPQKIREHKDLDHKDNENQSKKASSNKVDRELDTKLKKTSTVANKNHDAKDTGQRGIDKLTKTGSHPVAGARVQSGKRKNATNNITSGNKDKNQRSKTSGDTKADSAELSATNVDASTTDDNPKGTRVNKDSKGKNIKRHESNKSQTSSPSKLDASPPAATATEERTNLRNKVSGQGNEDSSLGKNNKQRKTANVKSPGNKATASSKPKGETDGKGREPKENKVRGHDSDTSYKSSDVKQEAASFKSKSQKNRSFLKKAHELENNSKEGDSLPKKTDKQTKGGTKTSTIDEENKITASDSSKPKGIKPSVKPSQKLDTSKHKSGVKSSKSISPLPKSNTELGKPHPIKTSKSDPGPERAPIETVQRGLFFYTDVDLSS